MTTTTWHRARSAITGRFVTWYYALRHPKTTVTEEIIKNKTFPNPPKNG